MARRARAAARARRRAGPSVHPPVSAAELPPLDAPAKKAPFWKKELSRLPQAQGREGREGAKAEKAARAPKEKGAPFWKKELSLGRKPKAAAAEAPTEQLPVVAKTPLHKRKLSLP